LAAAGHTVHREYYINDGVNSEQMRLFAESVMALAEGRELPENGYKGDYVKAVAQAAKEHMTSIRAHIYGEEPDSGAWLARAKSLVLEWMKRAGSGFSHPRIGPIAYDAALGIPFEDSRRLRALLSEITPDQVSAIVAKGFEDAAQSWLSQHFSRSVVITAVSEERIKELHSEFDIDPPATSSPMNHVLSALYAFGTDKEDANVSAPFDVSFHWDILENDFEDADGAAPNNANETPMIKIVRAGRTIPVVSYLSLPCRRFLEDACRTPGQIWLGHQGLSIRGDCVHDEVKNTTTITVKQLLPNEARVLGSLEWHRAYSEQSMIRAQREGLGLFGVHFDTWFSEQSLVDQGIVHQCIEELEAKGAADAEPHRIVVKTKKGGAIETVEHQLQAKEEDDTDNRPSTNDESGQSPTLWLRSTKFGDDMDRVLRRRDGRLTYISSDVAYHRDKFNRPEGADRLITILGPDHHGYIGRLQAVVAAMRMESPLAPDQAWEVEGGALAAKAEDWTEHDALIYRSPQEKAVCQAATAEARERLHVQIYQLVRFLKDGKPAPMRKRDGNIYALIDLIREIGEQVRPTGTQEEKDTAGKDVARFFYLMRHHDTTFDFDLDLAARQSDENPVFYVQYAHARICSVIERAAREKLTPPTPEEWPALAAHLAHDREKSLLIKALDLPEEIARCAEDYAVSRLATYSIELARSFHHFYDACRVADPEAPELSRARLGVCVAARTALQAVLEVLGVSAPERMDRAQAQPE
jgi:arginyl-tRNA synthetase